LTQRGGSLRSAVDRQSVVVFFENEPQYILTPVPAGGKYGTCLKQSINGKRLPTTGTFPTGEAAVRGGLEDLRKALGW
jgi:hypothetical protein